MPDYRVFGGVLRSELPFPELPTLPAAPRMAAWTLGVGEPQPLADAVRIGSHRYAGDVEATLLRAGGRWRVAVSDLGAFDLDDAVDGGVHITWRPALGAREAWARFDVLGRVLPIVLHRAGALVLHGSAVALTPHAAIAFVAPKGHGKSTLALALAQRGGRLLSDDATALQTGAPDVLAMPGVHAVRLWPDSAAALDTDAYGDAGSLGRKLVVHAVPPRLRGHEPTPLRAIYVLDTPTAGGATAHHTPHDIPHDTPHDTVRRTPLGEVVAAVTLVRHATAGGLLGGDEAAAVLERAAAIVRRVPVYTLHLVREYARLDEIARVIGAWHDAPALAPSSQPSTSAST